METSTDHPGDPSNVNSTWTATQSLSPAQQGILDSTNKLNQGLMDTAGQGLDYANSVLSKPGVDTSQLAQTGINPGQSYQDAMMSRLQPQIDRENQQSDAHNAKRVLNQSHNDLLNNATVQGFNTGLAANQQGFQQQAYNQMQPINVINALRTGSQVQGPSFTNVPQQQTTAGADLLGAAQSTYNANLNSSNASNAANSNFTNGLFSLGGAALMSDIRLKSNIKRIGTHPLGIGIYEYDIQDRHETGVMAQELLTVRPDAVLMGSDGFYRVNYWMI
jgi:hypothetical protein